MPSHSYPQIRLGGADGPLVSAIGYGAMGMGARAYGSADEKQTFDVLTAAANAGVTFWDTSDAYGSRHHWKMACGNWPSQGDLPRYKWGLFDFSHPAGSPEFYRVNSKPSYTRERVELAFKALQTDYIDLLYQHRVDARVPIELVLETLRPYIETGTVKWIGLSECSVDVMKRAKAVPGIGQKVIAAQMEYSPFEIEIDNTGFVDEAKKLDISVVAYSPLGRGIMTGQYKSRADFEQSDIRQFMPRFSDENFPANLKITDEFKTVAANHNITTSQLALAWILARHPDIVSIPGTRSVQRVEENAQAVHVKLTTEDMKILNEVVEKADVKGDRIYITTDADQLTRRPIWQATVGDFQPTRVVSERVDIFETEDSPKTVVVRSADATSEDETAHASAKCEYKGKVAFKLQPRSVVSANRIQVSGETSSETYQMMIRNVRLIANTMTYTCSAPLPTNPSPQLEVVLSMMQAGTAFDLEAFGAFTSDDYTHHFLPENAGLPKSSKAEFMGHISKIGKLFATFSVEVKEIIESPNVIVLYTSIRGTTKGGNVNDADMVNMVYVREEADETWRVTKSREYVDTAKFAQFGAAVQKEMAAHKHILSANSTMQTFLRITESLRHAMPPSPTVQALDESSSAWAALHGHKAKTPMISGIVSGGAVGLAWIIGFIVYFFKRHRREKRALARGYRGHREMLDPPKKPEAFIIPPDPAIVQGQLEPGDRAEDGPGQPDIPLASQERQLLADSEKNSPTDTPMMTSPDLSHTLSAQAQRSNVIRYPPYPAIHSTTTVASPHNMGVAYRDEV
ncbi:hypothetical protein EIP91_009617 [Steccherinum ochraceum]|uniref:NADP-dependent oxidoreductase domain-containing protein n=1 Tax=Steccherinum ochraceum TaxID=92696 RepID=A0A4R0RE56_9APHY|nr:hypothetical protein EIP91_009617 [Steccherinum ochraceum]